MMGVKICTFVNLIVFQEDEARMVEKIDLMVVEIRQSWC